MLPDNNGYEPRYDFANPAPMRTFYMIATIPRTGSTWLSHLLWGTGCLGAPLEYLNFAPDSPYGFAADSPEAQQRQWREVVARRTSPNGVFGIKCFPEQLALLQETNLPLLGALFSALMKAPGGQRIVYLRRRDRVAQTVSLARAALSGVWREDQEAGLRERPEYSEEAFESVERGIDFMAGQWEAMFRDLGIEPLRLWYEDVVANPGQAVAQVAAHVGVTLDPAAAIAVPEIRKQTAAEIQAWTERYAQSKDAP